MFDRAFASIAGRVSAVFGGPYWPGSLVVPGTGGGYDGEGVYQPGTPPTRIACQVQVNDVTDYMRANEGYTDGDVSLLVIDTNAQVTTDMQVEIAGGPRAGVWMISTPSRDPAAIGWRIKARPA
ncbi:MAG: hypothetical protein PGN16_04200 [Sphingomonas phyllosphaerae]|uniref:hypothetical protein n=1 Tax=Sphingomonas phyllosphaerae TaxID=257003 RepID=UPI002FF4608D